MTQRMTARSVEEMAAFLEAAKEGFEVGSAVLPESGAWAFSGGALSHRSGGFFQIVGVEFDGDPAERSVFLYQPQSAVTGLICARSGRETHFLLQARPEPGLADSAQYGPTIQTTPANYLKFHRGNATPFIEYFLSHHPGVSVIGDTMQLDLGERYLGKSKRLIFLEARGDLPLPGNFVWVPAGLVVECAASRNIFNPDLRSLFAVAPWGIEPGGRGIVPTSPDIRASLAAPVRPEVLGGMVSRIPGVPRPWRFVDLSELENWEWSEAGGFEKSGGQGFDVGIFQTRSRHREVSEWVQPLINSRSEGYAALCCRRSAEGAEVLVRVGPERGLSTGSAVLPTILRYPGSPDDAVAGSFRVLARTVECDEGGRFFRDTSVYEIVQADDAPDAPGSFWIRISELKALLAISNTCSIQLRGLASMLPGIDFEKPITP